MRRKWLICSTALAASFTVLLFILEGCGGGGGALKPPETPSGPTVSAQFLELLPAGQKDATYIGMDKCIGCHANNGNANAPQIDLAKFQQTKHAQVSVGCEQCHGAGSKHAANPSTQTILAYPRITRSVVCAQCHGPMAADYEASPHAEIVEDPVEGASATCMRCHSAPFRTEFIEEELAQGKSRDEVDQGILALTAEERKAVAEETKETASCATCHDPHRTTDNLTLEGKQAQIRHALTNTDTTDVAPGAPVKTYTTIEHSCARCHNGRGANPADSALTTGTTRPNMHDSPQFNMLMGISGVEVAPDGSPAPPVVRNTAHATAPGQCTHCHMPNARHTMTVSYDTSCAPCHTAADAAARTAIRGEVQLRLFALRSRMEGWAKTTFNDTASWDYTSLIPAGHVVPPQAQVPIQVKRARHNYYFVLRDLSFGIHNAAYTRYLLDNANKQLDSLGIALIVVKPGDGRAAIDPRIVETLKADRQRARDADRAATL